jgi:V8-like Glu-specific endopeptidase
MKKNLGIIISVFFFTIGICGAAGFAEIPVVESVPVNPDDDAGIVQGDGEKGYYGFPHKATITSPVPGSKLEGDRATFVLKTGSSDQYHLTVGTTEGGNDIFDRYFQGSSSVTVEKLPTDGTRIYVRLCTLIGSSWEYKDYKYVASGGKDFSDLNEAGETPVVKTDTENADDAGIVQDEGEKGYYGFPHKATITSPVPGSKLEGDRATFVLKTGSSDQYHLTVGTAEGGNDIFDRYFQGSSSVTVEKLPTDGTHVYVRLHTLIGGSWKYKDYKYIASGGKAFFNEPVGTKIGETATINLETKHPYEAGKIGDIIKSFKVNRQGSTFIIVHFSDFSLNDDDYVEIRDADGIVRQIITNDKPGKTDFWSFMVDGDTAFVNLISGSVGGKKAFGFHIDQFAYSIASKSARSIIGDDDKVDIECVIGTTQYQRARSVGRMVFSSGGYWYSCTGFLVSNDGHFLTNEHCIDSQGLVDTLQVYFDYQYTTCGGSNLASYNSYYGDIFLTSDYEYDCSLMTLSGGPQFAYGHLGHELNPRSVVLDETVYIPQHPLGVPKQYHSEDVVDAVADGNTSDSDFGYVVDTENGSSGSPVISMSDHTVIGLHHWGSQEDPPVQNQGVLMQNIHPIIEPFLARSVSCVDNYIAGTNKVVFPVGNMNGNYNVSPYRCEGTFWLDTRGSNWNSYCSTGWEEVDNVWGITCIDEYVSGSDEVIFPVMNTNGQYGEIPYRCAGSFWCDTRGSNWDSYCSTGWEEVNE